MAKIAALEVECRECGAPPGQGCHTLTAKKEREPHYVRDQDAKRQEKKKKKQKDQLPVSATRSEWMEKSASPLRMYWRFD